jgi:hypothetical protein
MNILRHLAYKLESGWLPEGELSFILEKVGFKVEYLEDHNRTDGEIHMKYSIDGEEFIFRGNGWNAKTVEPLLDWIDRL